MRRRRRLVKGQVKLSAFGGKVWPIHATTKSTLLQLALPHRIWNYERFACVLSLSPSLSLQFLARFKAQLIPSFFVQLSCLFFAHMEAAEQSEFGRPFLRILAPASTHKQFSSALST